MIKLNKIYTRTGDDGTTGLGTGERIVKNAPRMHAIGTIDEVNSHIGLARLHAGTSLDAILANIQNDLFDIGADLCMPENDTEKSANDLRINQAQIDNIEEDIDALNAKLDPLTSFILPGGTPLAATLHLARTVARRAERDIVTLDTEASTQLNPLVLKYINRLSDFLFVAARMANNQGAADVLWVPGKNRTR